MPLDDGVARPELTSLSEAAARLLAVLRPPSEIVFGAGMRDAVGWLAAREGRRAYVLVDPHVAEQPVVADLLRRLGEEGLVASVSTDVAPELPSDLAHSVAADARRHDSDLVIAVGGGSCIDLAKVVATLLRHGGRPSDYYGELRVPGPVVPVIAVPTTAGTGSEATPVAVVADAELGMKVGLSSPYLVPRVAVCDPELTLSCPPGVTAAAGADALAHCIEALTARSRQGGPQLPQERVFVGRGRLTDTLALEGIGALARGLHAAYTDPGDLAARAETMYGSLLGGLAFGTAGTAAAHALQYPIGVLTGTAHGVGVGCLLPYVMAYNVPERVPEMAAVARAFGHDGEDQTLARRAPHLVRDFLTALGIPRALSEIGVTASDAGAIAEQGVRAVRLSENNPRRLDVDAARVIVQAAIDGALDDDAILAPQ